MQGRVYLIEQCQSSCFCLLQEIFKLVQKLRKFASHKDECSQVPEPRRGKIGMVTHILKENTNTGILQLLVLMTEENLYLQ